MKKEIVPHENPQAVIKAEGFCGEATKNPEVSGTWCTFPAGYNTTTPGRGPCFMHGGEPRSVSQRYLAGLRVEVIPDLLVMMNEDPNPLSSYPELNLARALALDYVNRWAEWREALLGWWASYAPAAQWPDLLESIDAVMAEVLMDKNAEEARREPYHTVSSWLFLAKQAKTKPREILDLSEAVKLVSEVTKIVERIQKSGSSNNISRASFMRIMTEIGNVIEQTVTDEKTKYELRKRISQLRLA